MSERALCTTIKMQNVTSRGFTSLVLNRVKDSVAKTPTSSSKGQKSLLTRWKKKAAQIGIIGVMCLQPAETQALVIRMEPANALSLPTWIIHVSSVLEWVTAMALIWKFAEVTGNEKWKGMTWGMMPLLGGAMCALTWHFFYNSPDLSFIVTIQGALTFIGNCTCGVAAYRIYKDSQLTESDS